MRRSRIKLKIENPKIYLVAATVLWLCSLDAAGQEPIDSTAVSTHVITVPVDSSEIVSPDTIVVKSDLPDITNSGYILISDTVNVFPSDNLDMDAYARHSPAKAAIMSAVLPGLGQIYNRKYWEIPIVFAAIGISVERFITFQNQYNRYRRAYIDIKDGDPHTNSQNTLFPGYNDQQKEQIITRNKEKLRTWRDWSIVAMVAAYSLNIIWANVDAHLMYFSLDDNISLHIRPSFLKNDFYSQKIALTLQLTF